MGRLDGKSALLVGSASGAGKATALKFAAEGAFVVVADINQGGAEAVAEAIRVAGGTAVAAAGDISVESDVIAIVESALSAFGTVDILHNNAAALHLLARDQELTGLDVEVIDQTFAVNVKGPILMCKHVLPGMLERGGGVIINTASMAGVQSDTVMAAYSASKAAVIALSRSVATQYGKRGVRCNTIVPNLMLTERALQTFDEDALRLKLSERLLPRLGTPEDLANVALFLASDESGYIQGQAILMDGGDIAHRPSISVQAWRARD